MRGICPTCGIYIDSYGRCGCTTKAQRRHTLAAWIMAVVVFALLMALPAKAESRMMYMPTVRQDPMRQWFTDAELTQAMMDAGLPAAQWDMYTTCTPDPWNATGLQRYVLCGVALNRTTGSWQDGVMLFWYDYDNARMAWGCGSVQGCGAAQ